ncbi:MAG: VOC family protein [Lachnospiraceae bacterium]|nr:VOC family protein [Lachnospiraceae bacterium]
MRIEHMAMYVQDLEAARDFFVDYFGGISNEGYHNETTDFRSYFISFDDGSRLEIMNKPAMETVSATPDRTGYIHIAFSVGSREKVDELTECLSEAGYKIISGPRTTGDGYYESSVAAIEENIIEITI